MIRWSHSYLVGSHRLFCASSEDTLTAWRIVRARQDIDDRALVDWKQAKSKTLGKRPGCADKQRSAA